MDQASGLRRDQQLRGIGKTIGRLDQCCRDLKQHVLAARQDNAPVLEEATNLLRQKHETETKKELLDAFNKHFIISEQEMLILTNASENVDDEFFMMLKRLKQIYVDCQVLLGSENQGLGLEFMDQSSRNLNIAYQKLYRWSQKEFKTLNLENPQISTKIRRALKTLAERPSLFQSCLELFAEARNHVLTDSFYAALTGSTSENDQDAMTKPIEFYAHDTLRYVGDMLAWAHSTTVSERESLEGLFLYDGEEIRKGIKAGREAEPWTAEDGEIFDGQKALRDLVNQNITGMTRALRQRVEQVLHSHESAVLLYKLTNLFSFYRITFEKLLGSGSSFLDILSSLQEASIIRFRAIMSENLQSIRANLHVVPTDLSSPDFLDDWLAQFAELMASYDSSLTPTSARTADFRPVVTLALEPVLLICERMVENNEPPEKSIFQLNCLLSMRIMLGNSDFLEYLMTEIDDQIEHHTLVLIEYQHAFFLHTSSLHPLLSALAPLDDSPESIARIVTLPPFQRKNLSDTSQSLDDFLPSALVDSVENLKYLKNAKLAQDINQEAVERFCEDFDFIEGKLAAFDESNKVKDFRGEERRQEEYVPLRTLFPRTSGEIKVLLS